MYVSLDLASLLFMLSCILFLPYLECAAVDSAQDVVTACRLSEWQKLRIRQLPLRLDVPLFSSDKLCLKFEYVLFTSQNVDWKMLRSRACLHLLQRDDRSIFLPSSLFFSWIVYFICLLFSPFLSIISAPLFLYVALSALLGLMLENEWELCHIQSAVHLCSMPAIVSQWTREFESSPFISFGWLEDVLRLITWSSGIAHTCRVHTC